MQINVGDVFVLTQRYLNWYKEKLGVSVRMPVFINDKLTVQRQLPSGDYEVMTQNQVQFIIARRFLTDKQIEISIRIPESEINDEGYITHHVWDWCERRSFYFTDWRLINYKNGTALISVIVQVVEEEEE